MSRISHIIIYIITTLFISCIAVYLYVISVVKDLDYYNKYDLQDGLFIGAIELLIYLGLSTFLLQKIIQKNG